MLRTRPPIQELEMQALREPAGAPVDQHMQRIASPGPFTRHVRANARVRVDMMPGRANTVAPAGPDAHHGHQLGIGVRKGIQSMWVVQRDFQEQPTAIRERPNDPNVNRHERETRRATNDSGTGVPVLELFEPENYAQPTPEGLWGRTGRDGGRTGFSGGRTGVTGGRLGFSGCSGFSGGRMGFSGGSTGFGAAICPLPQSESRSRSLEFTSLLRDMTIPFFLPRIRSWDGYMPGDDEPALFHVDVWPVGHIGGRAKGPQGFEVQLRSLQGELPRLRGSERPGIGTCRVFHESSQRYGALGPGPLLAELVRRSVPVVKRVMNGRPLPKPGDRVAYHRRCAPGAHHQGPEDAVGRRR